MTLSSMPVDILNEILQHIKETIEYKIQILNNLPDLNHVYDLVMKKYEDMYKEINNNIKKNCIYKLVFIDYKDKIEKEVLCLINNKSIISSCPTIRASIVVEDDNERIYGKYKIIEKSILIFIKYLIHYELVYERPEVIWSDEKDKFVGIKDPWFLYRNHPRFNGYVKSDYPISTLSNQTSVDLANLYSIAIFVRSTKNHIFVKLPVNPTEDSINREHYTSRLPKRIVYKLLNQNIPLVRPNDIY
jgi:hypothetical protein